jgi:hypothetical protein
MTAVEWLKQNLPSLFLEDSGHYAELFEQALEMEKQQIIDAVEWGNRKGYDEHRLTCILDEDEQYYNETYKPSI